MRTLVLGLGNPILTDDAVGLRVAAAVEAALAAPGAPAAAVATASVGGLALMECLVGYERAVLVDACVRPDCPPGTVQRLSLAELGAFGRTERSISPHDTSLDIALELGRQLGLALPDELVLIAVAVAVTAEFGAEPTPAVAAAIPVAAAAVLAELT